MGNKVQLTHVTGLRGIAILLVVWFHFTTKNGVMPGWLTLPNGYYGVDVFLTIMGYFLIMGFANKPDMVFSKFALSKFHRILPPLAIVILLTTFLCMMVLNWQEYRAMCKTGFTALFGLSNYELMYSSAGYFADNTAMNPLLHSWYLSVTLQVFAIGYIMYAVVKRVRRSVCLLVLGVIGGLSLASHLGGSSSYYSTFPRLWEILSGGAVCLLPNVKNGKVETGLTYGGLLMILLTSLSHNESTPLWSVIVVLGTMLCVKYGSSLSSWGCNVLGNKVICFIGSVSFSLYLVHMPLLVMVKGLNFDNPNVWVICLLLVASVGLAWLFYRIIERRRIALWIGVLCCLLSAVLCAVGFVYDWRRNVDSALEPRYTDWQACTHSELMDGYDKDVLLQHTGWYILADGSGKAPMLDLPFVHIGDARRNPHFVLLGDSHAQASWMGLDVVCRDAGLSGVYLASIIAPFWDREVPSQGGAYYYNRTKANALIEWLKLHPELKTVVVDQLWLRLNTMQLDWDLESHPADFDANAQAFLEFCNRLKNIDKEIVIMGPLPMYSSGRIVGFVRSLRRYEEHDAVLCTHETFNRTYERFLSLLSRMEKNGVCKVVYPHSVLSTPGGYPAIKDGVPMFKDADHLSVQGSLYVMKALERQIITVLAE